MQFIAHTLDLNKVNEKENSIKLLFLAKYCILCLNKTRYVFCMWIGLLENLFSPQICIEGQLRAGIWLAPRGGSCRLWPQEAQDSNRACQVLREWSQDEKTIYVSRAENMNSPPQCFQTCLRCLLQVLKTSGLVPDLLSQNH